MNKAYLILGSNLGNRFDNILKARDLLGERIGIIIKVSNIYETEPWGLKEQPNFLNQALIIETGLVAIEILREIGGIENELGRVRYEKWGERIIDVDILFYNSLILNTTELIIPQPLINERRFTLEPLSEIAAEYMHPVFNKSIKELLETCGDRSKVNRVEPAIRKDV